jgi:p70 ribosomal S6 kinase
MDYVAGGDLFAYLELRAGTRRVDYDDVRIFSRDVLTALSHVHRVGLVHLDLKPEHIYLQTFKDQTRAILGGFGTAQPQDLQATKIKGRTTLPYAPPEYHHSPVRISPAFDIWSLGIVLYASFTGTFPFELLSASTNPEDIEGRTVREGLESDLAQNGAPGEAIDAIMGMLRFNPEDRLTVAGLTGHPFFALELEPVGPVAAAQADTK